MRHWPLTQLTLTTRDLVLRVPDDSQIDELAQVAANGIVPPGAVYFPQPWASGTAEQAARNVVQNHWWARGDWHEDNWRLLLVVLHDGQVIGQQNLSAHDFRVTHEARTGFWLGRRLQGHGFGTQMRAAALHLAFASLGAERVISTAFADNTASRRVSEKFGYESNGVRRLAVDQHLVEAHDATLTAERWRGQARQPTLVEGFDECRHMFGVPAAPEPIDVVLHV
ncbi:GNAT family protein [Streptomyces sp. NPDC050149]|uniref:GNAT family N-acetyltransferase n=1 Tax=unclassified Streptomyces TaxID=2593676 RepID=UPI002E350FD5|nr:GNAT family protein [Streptomyces sp. NBC_01358]WSW65620.1 GNAT family N-acetyltransferase [Streptomyces sp. NBC_00995]